MGLSRVWDYFMRRKLLLLAVMVMLVLAVIIGGKLFSGKADTAIEIPRTGEVVLESEVACNMELADTLQSELGDGINNLEDIARNDSDLTIWGAEAPEEIAKTERLDSNIGSKIEILIIGLGIIAEVAVLFGGKFIFDHYVR